MACAPSEDSDQPGHLPSLIRVFTVHIKKTWVLSYPLSASEDSDQPSLIWVFAGRTVILLVLSWGSSINQVPIHYSESFPVVDLSEAWTRDLRTTNKRSNLLSTAPLSSMVCVWYLYFIHLKELGWYGEFYTCVFKCFYLRSARTVKATFGVQSTVAVYTNHVFGGWDYAITNPKAAYVKRANLHREFKVCG